MNRVVILPILLTLVVISSCYYDVEQELYPKTGDVCDTTTVSFSQRLMTTINNSCISCHSSSLASGGIVLDNHADVAANIDAIIGAISHSSGFTPMPQGGAKLPNCEIAAFIAWKNHGSNNN